MTHKIRSAYGKKISEGITFTQPSLTKQSFTEECNINNIMEKYQKTGAIEHVNKHEASYGYATANTFQESLEIVKRGQTMFDELPSSIRTKFENNPAIFLEFVQDENNLEEMQELGLVKKPQIQPEPTLAKTENDKVVAKPAATTQPKAEA